MFIVRKSNERGHANHGWLDSYHTFSFADYYDPKFMGFSVLRVINEDRVAGGAGFPTHPHRDMEIVTYVIQGALKHRDTLGNEEVLKPGEIQRMSAGLGIRHSEFNANEKEEVHLLQIWLLTEKDGMQPSYEQKSIVELLEKNNLALIVSPEGREGSVRIFQDVDLYVGKFNRGDGKIFKPRNKTGSTDRNAWVQIVSGELEISGKKLSQGDGMAVSREPAIELSAGADCEFLLFDLP